MKILSVVKPYDKPINTVGASWVGIYLSNHLVHDPEVEKVGLLTRLADYSVVDPEIIIHEFNGGRRTENRDIITQAIELYKTEGYDIIHIHIGSLAVIKWIDTLVPDDVNVVYTLHSSLILGRSKMVYGPYGANINNRPNIRLVAVSDFMQWVWGDFTSSNDKISNLSTIYNGIVDYPDISIRPMSDRKKRVLVCGRITPTKNTYEIIKMLAQYDIPAVVIGDNFITHSSSTNTSNWELEYYNWCKDLLESPDNKLEWYRSESNKAVRELMADSYATIHMTQMEACALVPLESLSVGTPVIYTKTDSVIEEMNQNLIDVSNPDDYNTDIGAFVNYTKGSRWSTRYRTMNSIIQDIFENPKDPEIIVNYYHKYFGIDRMINNYKSLYRDLLNRSDN